MIWQGESRIIGTLLAQSLVNPGSASEQSMGTITLPAGTLAPGRAIRVSARVSNVSGGSGARCKVYLGGSGGDIIANEKCTTGYAGMMGIAVGITDNIQSIGPQITNEFTPYSLNTSVVADATYDSTTEIDIEVTIALTTGTESADLDWCIVEQI